MDKLRADLAEIYRRLYSRLNITQSAALDESPGVGNTIQPVYNVEEVIWRQVVESQTSPTVTGVGRIVGWTCPTGFQYKLQGLQLALASGTMSVSHIWYEPYDNVPEQIPLFFEVLQVLIKWPSTYYSRQTLNPALPIIMLPGDTLPFNVDAHTVNGTWALTVLAMKAPYY